MQTVSNGVSQAPSAVKRAAIKQSNGHLQTTAAASKEKENVKHTFDKKGDWSLMTATR